MTSNIWKMFETALTVRECGTEMPWQSETLFFRQRWRYVIQLERKGMEISKILNFFFKCINFNFDENYLKYSKLKNLITINLILPKKIQHIPNKIL